MNHLLEPKLDVLVTCFNEREFIAQALESVLCQSAIGLVRKLIVINDGSTDGSAALLDQLSLRRSEIEVHHIENRGLSGARNYGLAHCSAPFVALLDGDDIWHPLKLERQWSEIQRSPAQCAIWYTDYIDFEVAPEDGHPVSVRRYGASNSEFLQQFFVFDGPIIPSSVVLRRAALNAAGDFDEEIKLFEDMELWLRLGCAGFTAQHVPGFLLLKRRRAGGLSSNPARWEAAMSAITDVILKKEPSLEPLARRRLAYRLAKIGYGYLLDGQDKEALSTLLRSLAKEPFSLRAILYLSALALPFSIRRSALRTIKRTKTPRGDPARRKRLIAEA